MMGRESVPFFYGSFEIPFNLIQFPPVVPQSLHSVHRALEIASFDAPAFFHHNLAAGSDFGNFQQLLLRGFL
jgi:hypothetical protein